MQLSVEHLTGAKILLEDVEGKMRAVFDRIAMTESGSLTEEFYSCILSAPNKKLARSTLLRKLGHKLSAQDLTKIVETLVMAKRIRLDTVEGVLTYFIDD